MTVKRGDMVAIPEPARVVAIGKDGCVQVELSSGARLWIQPEQIKAILR
jgi:hypothetical protein